MISTLGSRVMAFLQPLTGLAPELVIWAQGNGPRPTKLYVAMQLVSRPSPEHDIYLPPEADGTQGVQTSQDSTLQIDAYGDGANDFLERFRQRLAFETTLQLGREAQLAVFHRGQITDLTMILDKTNWEERALLEVGIRSTFKGVDNVGLIEQINIGSDVSKSTVLNPSPTDTGTGNASYIKTVNVPIDN